MSDVRAVILAAGKGERMGGETPKVLRPIWGRPLISYLLDTVEEVGVGTPLVITGHGEEEVREVLDGRAEFLHQERQGGTGHAVRTVRDQVGEVDGSLLILYGDVPGISVETLRSFLDDAGRGPCIVTMEVDYPTGYGRVLRNEDGSVRAIREEKEASEAEKAIPEVNAGVYVLPAKMIFGVLDELGVHGDGEIYLTDAVEALARRGETVRAWKAPRPEEFLGVNRPGDLVTASGMIQDRILERHLREGVVIVDPSKVAIDDTVKLAPGVVIHPFVTIEEDVEIGAGTVVLPFSFIHGSARIGEGCMIGPFSHLRGEGNRLEDGAEVGNFVEMKHATLGPRSKAKHLSYLGDVTIGGRANIGAGTIVANYDGKKKYPTEIGDRAFIGSGTILVAPVKVGEGATTGAGAVVTRGRDVADGDVVVGVPAKPLRGGEAGKDAKEKVNRDA